MKAAKKAKRAKAVPKLTAKDTRPKTLEEMTGEELATRALEGYGDGPIAYAALITLHAELSILCDAVDTNEDLKEALFAMANRARIAAELDKRAAEKSGAP